MVIRQYKKIVPGFTKPLTNNAVEQADPNDRCDSPESVPEQQVGVLEHAGDMRK